MTEPDLPLVERTGVLAGDPSLLRERDTALGALTTVRAGALAPLVRAGSVGDAHALTYEVPADAVELALLRDRVPLRAGHVVAVLLAVLEALDAVHRAHLAHGGVTAERVLVAPDGSVLLGGCGLAWAVPPGVDGGPVAADDIADVAVLARRLLGSGSAPPALVVALLRAADPDPAMRPDAASLAASVRAALPAEPLLDLLWLAAPQTLPRRRPVDDVVPSKTADVLDAVPSTSAAAPISALRRTAVKRTTSAMRPRARRRPRAAFVAAAVALPLLGWAVLRVPTSAEAGPPSVGAGPAAPAPSPRSSSASLPAAGGVAAVVADVRWAAVLAGLDDVRRQALAAGSVARLADAVDPAGSAWAADARLAASVAASAAHLTGGALRPVSVRVVSESADRVALRVVDVRSAYDVELGGTVTHVAARPATAWEVVLVRAGDRWRIGDVVAVRR